MKKIIFFILLFVPIFLLIFLGHRFSVIQAAEPADTWWEVQSIDTMKYSRDLAREKLKDQSFDSTIELQIRNISELGATHVAIGTPYDEEFVPYLTRWVSYARKYGLKVWFRGNFAGWEKWFDYTSISPQEHYEMTRKFILDNPGLFEDGDIFTSCPECENGGPGDPRLTGEVEEFRNFIIEEYKLASAAFGEIDKNVSANYFSMNGDVAELIMDKPTTKALDGIIVVDHYVSTPEQLLADVKRYAEKSGGKVVLGEVGVPIPDIHGNLSPEEQAQWFKKALSLLAAEESLVGVNYWVLSGGSTALLDDKGNKRPIADVISQFYKPRMVNVRVVDEFGRAINGALVKIGKKEFETRGRSSLELPIVPGISDLEVTASGYKNYTISIDNVENAGDVHLRKERENLLFRFFKYLRSLFI